jgi:hypothetical protein
MGNRGCLHDERQRIRRPFACKRWIICVLEFRGRQRSVMTPGHYTELFFLDEATALAAGHRPCAECQRSRYLLFRDLWASANPDRVTAPTPSAEEIDQVLHAERVADDGGKRTYLEQLSRLPGGVMVANAGDEAFLVRDESLVPWTPAGYGVAVPRRSDAMFRVLTPKSVVRTLARGYPVGIHSLRG